ncbi:hypothetical protein A6R68_19677, partial [Neotoma lepida]
IVTPESAKSSSDDDEQQVELAEEMENEICRVWDMSMDEDVALFLQEFKAPDIFMGVLAKSRCPRLRVIDLLVKVGEVVDKLFDLDEKLMLEWIRNGTARLLDQPQEDSEEQPVFLIVPCVLEAAKQVRSENLEGLDVYMHILQLLTTVDDGVQAIGKCPGTGKDTWNLLFDLVCHEFCQAGDPPIILQEQKTVLASVLSVLSAISASGSEQEHLEREEGKCMALPLIDSLIRVLQNMEHCQKKAENSTDSDAEEPTNCGSTQDDFHMKILKDISCEFLSNVFQALTKETVAQGLKEGQLSKQKCSCAFQSLLPLYSPVVEDFIQVLHEVDKTLAEDLEESFPSVKAQT